MIRSGNRHRRAISFILFIFLFALLPSAGRAGEKQENPLYTVELATIVPTVGPAAELIRELEQELLGATRGRMKLVIHAGGIKGDEPDIVRKMRSGQLQGGIMLTAIGMGLICPEMKVLQLPFLFNDYDEVDHVLHAMRPMFSRLFAQRKAYLVSWSEIGFGYFLFRNPIRGIGDLEKMKMVTFAGDPIFTRSEQAVGFRNLVPMHISDMLHGLETGVIDGTFGTLTSMVALQLTSRARYFLNVPFAYSPGGTVVDQEYFDRLPADLQEIFLDVLRNWEPLIIHLVRMMEEELFHAFPENGISEISPETTGEISRWMRDRTLPLHRSLAGEFYSPELLAEVQARLNEYRAGRGARR